VKVRVCKLAEQFVDAEIKLRRGIPKVFALAAEFVQQVQGVKLPVVLAGAVHENIT
jgi:hypothetical protein